MKSNSAYKLTGIMAAVMAAAALNASAQVPSTTAQTAPGQDVPSQATAPGANAPSTTPAPTPQDTDTTATPDPMNTAPDASAPAMDDVAAATSDTSIAAPKDFMRQAFLANEFGIAAAQLAVQNGSTQEVKDTAQQVLNNGMKTRTDMIAAIQGSTSDMHFDQSWSDDYKQKLAELQTLQGADFDARYLEIQGQITNDNLELYQNFASTASDESVKTFASNALPTLTAEGDSLESVSQGGQ